MSNRKFSINVSALTRAAYVAVATLLLVAGFPLFGGGKVYAATQLGQRSIQMSDSGASSNGISTGVGSGTSVVYEVSIVTTASADSIVIDFCTQDPIIGDTCTKPTGLTLTTGVAVPTGVASPGPIAANWTATTTAHGVELADGAGETHAASAGTHVFDLTGITNPQAPAGTFYARVYTYTHHDFESSGSGYTSPTAPGDYVNYGGLALATTNTITVTARVQESLSFCVTAADPNNWSDTANSGANAGDCAAAEVAAAPPAVILGTASGSGQPVLSSQTVDVGSGSQTASDNAIWTQLSTNATHGAVIDMRNSNGSSPSTGLCGGLSADSGATCAIPALDTLGGGCTSTTACAMTAGSAAFGLFVNQYTPTANLPGTVGTLTPQQPYYNSSHCGSATATNPCVSNSGTTWFGMDSGSTPANSGTPATNLGNVTSEFGSIVSTSSSALYHFDQKWQFAATAALTTPAGIYTANINLIATGSF
ncbi:MAG TPA: hypothetical protein VG604_01610 [Candidatus Saccharimonadales bacterium]|nr:hypothetical protein [Candidatus Saccharimonadales bacterium]